MGGGGGVGEVREGKGGGRGSGLRFLAGNQSLWV